MYCNKCGTYLPEDAQFCPSCGTPITGMPKKRNTILIGAIVTVVIAFIVSAAVFLLVMKNSEQKQLQAAEAVQKEDTTAAAAVQPSSSAGAADSTDNTDTKQDTDTSTPNIQIDIQQNTGDASTAQPRGYETHETHETHEDYSLDGTYLWPTDSEYISVSDLRGLSKDTVAAIRNEIYARHGYAFSTEHWQNYFEQKSWYHRDSTCTDSTVTARLSSIERANISTIISYEESQGWR